VLADAGSIPAVSTNQEFQGIQQDPLKRPKAPETGLFYACHIHIDPLASTLTCPHPNKQAFLTIIEQLKGVLHPSTT